VRVPSRRSTVFLFFVVTIVPVALLVYSAIAISSASAVDQAEKGAADSAQASSVFIRQRFMDVSDQLNSFAQGTLAPAMTDGKGPRYDVPAIGSQLADLTRLQNGIRTAFVTDPRGRVIAIAPQGGDMVGLYLSGDDWYQGASKRDTAFIAGLSPTAAGSAQSSVAIAIPIHGPAIHPGRVGYLVGLYDLAQIQAFVDDFARTQGTDLSIVDGQGFVLAAPGLTPGTVTSWDADDRMLPAALAGNSVVSEVTWAGTARLAAYAPVAGCDWAVVVDVPRAVALREASRLRYTVLAIAGVLGVVLVLALVVGQILVHRAQQSAALTQRMEALARLNEAARAVHADDGPRALEIIATSARELVVADLSAVGVREGTGPRMRSVAHDASPDLPRAGLGELATLLVTHGQPVVASGRGELGDLASAGGGAAPSGLGPFLSVPLVAGDRVLGCLVVSRVSGAPAFHAVNERQLQQMAQHATSVLENERHDAEREAFLDRLSESNEELERANQLKSQFLARMSHELRTPLSAIMGFSDLLLEGGSGELNGEQEDDVREIASAGRLLLDVINDILDLSRIEAGRMRLEMLPVRLGPLLADVASALRPLARGKALELRVEVECEDPPVLADPLRVRQVVTNLVSNGLKFTPIGWVVIHLRTRAGMAEVSVVDTGIGIPEEALESVFEEFTQVDGSSTRGFSGSGLGLSIARRLVELHDGTIGVESEVGVGSRFWFRLPLALDLAPADRAPIPVPVGEGVAP
jgi:signal transduction histidine kinase